MKILFIAGLYPKDQEKLYKNYCTGPYLQAAPNNSQWAFVEGYLSQIYKNFYYATTIILFFMKKEKNKPLVAIFRNDECRQMIIICM